MRRFGAGHLFAFLGRLPGWAFAYLATVAAGIVVILFIPWEQARLAGNAVRLNGSFFLAPINNAQLLIATVFDDGLVDTLTGGPGLNLFYASRKDKTDNKGNSGQIAVNLP